MSRRARLVRVALPIATAGIGTSRLPPSDSGLGLETGFEELPTGIDANLYAVTGTSANNVWAVGNRGAVVRYTGGE